MAVEEKRHRPNWWNLYQHYRRLASSGKLGDKWAFNFLRGLMSKDRLERYEAR